MNSQKKAKLVLSVLSAGLLSIVSASSQAGRSVRSDAGDSLIYSAHSGGTITSSPGARASQPEKRNSS